MAAKMIEVILEMTPIQWKDWWENKFAIYTKEWKCIYWMFWADITLLEKFFKN